MSFEDDVENECGCGYASMARCDGCGKRFCHKWYGEFCCDENRYYPDTGFPIGVCNSCAEKSIKPRKCAYCRNETESRRAKDSDDEGKDEIVIPPNIKPKVNDVWYVNIWNAILDYIWC